MSERKIFTGKTIDWSEKDITRLSYDMIFQDRNPEQEKANVEEELNLLKEEIVNEQEKKWQEKLKKIRETAFKEGFDEGVAQGYQKAGDEIDQRLANLEKAITSAHQEWKSRQETLAPGLLHLVFDIAEKILEIPVDNEKMRGKLEKELTALFLKIDEDTKPVLWVHKDDFEFVCRLKEQHIANLSLTIRVKKECKPGEFICDTDKEKIVQNFKTLLQDFKQKLPIPAWE